MKFCVIRKKYFSKKYEKGAQITKNGNKYAEKFEKVSNIKKKVQDSRQ